MAAAAKLHRTAHRARTRRFLAEGANLVSAAAARDLVVEVFVTDGAAARHRDLLGGLTAPVHRVNDRAAATLSDTVTPAGLVAVCTAPGTALADVLAAAPRRVVIAVGVGEPGNAGTLIRLADALGADAVVLTGHSVDAFNGKCLRASAGSIFALPVVTEPDTDAVLSAVRAAGLQLLATTPDGELALAAAGPVLAQPSAWLFGSEAHGLPADVTAAATHRVRIEMTGAAESLNVAAAAAICLYQSARAQR